MSRRNLERALLVPAGVLMFGLGAAACGGGGGGAGKSSSTGSTTTAAGTSASVGQQSTTSPTTSGTASGTTSTAASTTATSSGAGAGTVLTGTVGPGFNITLTDAKGSMVHKLPAGTYTIKVADRSPQHNFHLKGAGVDQSTTVPAQGDTTWTVKLTAGTYTYVCDPHLQQMRGSFTVT